MELKKRTAGDRFSIGTGVRVADQMLRALESLQEAGYVHRDVKPSNFVISSAKEETRMVYMIDFGLCRQYVDPISGKQRPPRMRCGFRETVRYACIDTMNGADVGRAGDLWSLLYVLVEMLKGQLPWRRVSDEHQVMELKQLAMPCLMSDLPSELEPVYHQVLSLDFYSRPDYERIRRAFAAVLTRCCISEDTR